MERQVEVVTVYLMEISQAEGLTEDYCRRYFPKRLEKAKLFRRREDQLRSLCAGALLSHAAIREADIVTGENGKPMLCGSGVHFNLSHSGRYVCLVTDRDAVGVDVEEIKPLTRDVSRRVLQPEELIWMEDDPESRMIRLWTMKESVMKADGEGMGLEPRSFSVLPMVEGRPIRVREREWFCVSRELDGYWLSICAGSNFSMPEIRRVTYENLD